MTSPALLIVFGAGGHGRVVADAALASGTWRGVIAADRNPARWGQELLPGVPIIDPATIPGLSGPVALHVAIGDNAARRREALALRDLAPPATVIHPRAAVAPSSSIAPGCLITAQCVVGPMAVLGEGVVINHGAVVDHDCRVDAWAHVAPGARLGGAVHVGASALVGAGATVLRSLAVGADAVLGAGAVLLQNLPTGEAWAGVPARPLASAAA